MVDGDWNEFRGDQFSAKSLLYSPSKKSALVERTRIEDYDRRQPELTSDDEQLLRKAAEFARNHFSGCEGHGELTNEETKQYILDSDCADSSPGYPLNLRFKTKREALEDSETYQIICSWVGRLGTGGVEACLFGLALKDEIQKTKKNLDLQTRLFMLAPLCHHFAMVKFCSRMHDWLMKDRGTWCSAGREFQHGGWNVMMRKLPFDWFIGIDCQMYDMSIFRVLFSLVCEIVCGYCPARKKELEDLFAMALDAFVVSGRGDVYWKHTGNPSGWYLTLFLNTVVNYVIMAYSWLRLHPDSTQEDFEAAVRAWLCGDDSLLSVRKGDRDSYTALHITQSLARLGITVKEVHESYDLRSIEYCGATSIEIDGVFCRRPRVSKFLNALQFSRDPSPSYRTLRACAIHTEMWTVSEAALVKSYVRWLVGKYPACAEVARKNLLSDRKCRYIHLGVE